MIHLCVDQDDQPVVHMQLDAMEMNTLAGSASAGVQYLRDHILSDTNIRTMGESRSHGEWQLRLLAERAEMASLFMHYADQAFDVLNADDVDEDEVDPLESIRN